MLLLLFSCVVDPELMEAVSDIIPVVLFSTTTSESCLVVEPTIYKRFCGREACRQAKQYQSKWEVEQRRGRVNGAHINSQKCSSRSSNPPLTGLNRMRQECISGEKTWIEIRIDTKCAIKMHSKQMHTHANVQLRAGQKRDSYKESKHSAKPAGAAKVAHPHHSPSVQRPDGLPLTRLFQLRKIFGRERLHIRALLND